MTARILIVDDVASNIKLLEVRLLAEYFDVLTATSGAQAIEACESGKVDVVLLDVMMPEMDGFTVCRHLKENPATQHIPVVMVTTLDQTADRVRGLEAGADDFLTKPVDDLQLITRVKNLARLKALTDELRMRAATTRNIGLDQLLAPGQGVENDRPANVLLIDEEQESAAHIAAILGDEFVLDIVDDPQRGFFKAVEGGYDCVLISTGFSTYDPLRLCSQLRALERTRFLPIVLMAGEGEGELVSRALDLAVNDYVARPANGQELIARLRTQIRRKHTNDALRSSVTKTMEMAVTDPLTGLHNRRYLDGHLQTLFDRAAARQRPLSVMMADIDRFKAINDSWGHGGGDDVLCEFARRLRGNIRGIDLVCRYGGEEFIIVMPDTALEAAEKVAERIRNAIAGEAFVMDGGDTLATVTTSIGVASIKPVGDTVAALIKRVDSALYEAKSSGRNRVAAAAA